MPEYVVSPHKILATHAFFGTLHVRNVEFAVGLDAKKKRHVDSAVSLFTTHLDALQKKVSGRASL